MAVFVSQQICGERGSLLRDAGCEEEAHLPKEERRATLNLFSSSSFIVRGTELIPSSSVFRILLWGLVMDESIYFLELGLGHVQARVPLGFIPVFNSQSVVVPSCPVFTTLLSSDRYLVHFGRWDHTFLLLFQCVGSWNGILEVPLQSYQTLFHICDPMHRRDWFTLKHVFTPLHFTLQSQ